MKTKIRLILSAAGVALLAPCAPAAQPPADPALLKAPLEKHSYEMPSRFGQDAGTLTVSLPRGWTIKADTKDEFQLEGRTKAADPKTKKEESIWFLIWAHRSDDEAQAQRYLKMAPPSDEKLAASGEEKVGTWSARWVDSHEIMKTYSRHNYIWHYARGRNTLKIEFHVPMFCFDQVRPMFDSIARSIDFKVAPPATPAPKNASKSSTPSAPKRP